MWCIEESKEEKRENIWYAYKDAELYISQLCIRLVSALPTKCQRAWDLTLPAALLTIQKYTPDPYFPRSMVLRVHLLVLSSID